MAPFVSWLRDHRKLLLALLAVAAGAGTAVLVVDVDGPGPAPAVTFIVKAPESKTIEVPAEAVEQAKASQVDDHDGLRSEQPAGVSPAQLDAAAAQHERLAATDQLPLVTPDAAPEQAGCSSRFVRNYSTRGGVRPRLFVLHYTVSANRPGWSDVDAITSLFNTPSFAASSNYIVDNEGHCAYIVRESDKAWTQATFNPVSISVEVINTGHEATYSGTAGLARLGQIVSDATDRWDIPLARGATSGCTVVRAGVVDHASLGSCGGGHGDIAPFSVDQVIAAAVAYRKASSKPTAPLTVVEQKIVAGTGSPTGSGHSRRYWCSRNADRRALLLKLGRSDGWKLGRGSRYQQLGRAWTKDCA